MDYISGKPTIDEKLFEQLVKQLAPHIEKYMQEKAHLEKPKRVYKKREEKQKATSKTKIKGVNNERKEM